LAKEAINFAPKSIPTKQAIPATNAPNTAAYLHKKKFQLQWAQQHKKSRKLDAETLQELKLLINKTLKRRKIK
jgi:hypothetical protein